MVLASRNSHYGHHVGKNQLASQTSPYLLQHVDNPVDWYPWGIEALERAQKEDKPLFLSIGYAACHWCHVMAHESFEDQSIADLINRSFIAIKIDREERPDLDHLYMAATQAATGHGGWPMTVFTTPDGRPFFAGTYFPPADRGNQPGFPRVLASLADAWVTQRDVVEEQAAALAEAVKKEVRYLDTLAAHESGDTPQYQAARAALIADLTKRFDARDGGFGGAPKFPRPSYLAACLVHYLKTHDSQALAMATTTLDAMAAGGLYDHLAGGFARYSVDREWLVPHFEKMLTDQALLVPSYLLAYQITKNPSYAQVVNETIEWVLSDLRLSTGGFASSVDADAAGVEGSHAVFTKAQVRAALEHRTSTLSAEDACTFFGITESGTFENGASVLARVRGASLIRTPEQEATRLALFDARKQRIQPTVDDKVLLEWNAMFASSLLQGAGALGNEEWAEEAETLVEFLDQTFSLDTGRLARSSRRGIVNHLAMLGDYAWLVDAMTRLYEYTGKDTWLARSAHLASAMIELFWDGELPTSSEPDQGSGFFTTGSDAETLLVRAKDLFDAALPSASAVATTSLSRLFLLTGNETYRACAERTLAIAATVLREHPSAVPDLVDALGWISDSIEVALPGDQPSNLALVRAIPTPHRVIATGSASACVLFDHRTDGVVYVCRQGVCGLPASTEAQIVEQIATAVRT